MQFGSFMGIIREVYRQNAVWCLYGNVIQNDVGYCVLWGLYEDKSKFSVVVITLYYQVRYWLEISVFIVNLLEDSCDTWLNSSVS